MSEVESKVVFGYARVSTHGQCGKDGEGQSSVEAQREKIASWATYQKLPVGLIDADEGISGAAMENRPALRRVLRAAISYGEGAVLVVYKLDRLGRNAIDVQETLAVLLDSKVRVVALSDGIDSASGMGSALLKLLTSILSTFAELEKETIRIRLLEGRTRAKSNNRVYTREPSYGRKRAEDGEKDQNGRSKALVPANEEERAIERIRTLRAEGLSYRAIVTQLDAEAVRPRRALKWSTSVVQRIATGKRAPAKTKANSRIASARALLLADVA